ncbi:hypothetical protein HK098_003668 [Nowakowskiella sp. JEL0407]|nr:hypothetical protein HK098_003668 [Nowakowskiella sp. JEL0407]
MVFTAFQSLPKFDASEVRYYGRKSKNVAKNFPQLAKDYVVSIFPLFQWIRRYNLTWFTGDIIAAVTVGLLILPQALAQAKIATLPPEYGLYTGFVGLVVYSFFATSKDATLGPTAVLSLLTSQLLASANTDANGADIFPKTTFAISLAFMTGVYQLIIGFLRIGFLANYIPSTVIQGFTTGAAVTIVIQQVPSLLGISGIETNKQPIYLAFRDILVNLYKTKVDAALGLTSLLILIVFKVLKANFGKRYRWLYWLGLASNGIVLVVYLLISFAIVKSNKDKAPFAIVGNIPPGFKQPQQPYLGTDLLSRVWIPAFTSTLISIIEQVGIAKAFGKKFGYTRNINASQEIIAVGLTNFVGSFLSAYPATGSFSRSAVKAASGVRTPIAGLFCSVIVVIGLYGLTGAFYYIPSSVLAAIIISAISELISTYSTFVEFWNVAFADFFVFIFAIIVTIFGGIETGIYTSVGLSAFIVLLRLSRPRVFALTKSKETSGAISTTSFGANSEFVIDEDEENVLNEGVLVVRFSESIEYPNSTYVGARLLQLTTEHTKYGGKPRKPADRLWFDDTEEKAASRAETVKAEKDESSKLDETKSDNILTAVVFDFSAVNVFDQAGFSIFRETRDELSRYAGRPVYFYFAHVKSHIKRNIIRLLSTLYNEDILPLIQSSIHDQSLLYQSNERQYVFFNSIEDAFAEAKLGALKVASSLVENTEDTLAQIESEPLKGEKLSA